MRAYKRQRVRAVNPAANGGGVVDQKSVASVRILCEGTGLRRGEPKKIFARTEWRTWILYGNGSQSSPVLPPVDLSQEAQNTSIGQKFLVFFLLLGL